MLSLLDIPRDRSLLRESLESQLLSYDLRVMLKRLRTFEGREGKSFPELETALGDSLANFQQSGFAALTEEDLDLLLARPTLLWDLQEYVMIYGGEYWDLPLSDVSDAVKGWLQAVKVLEPHFPNWSPGVNFADWEEGREIP